jgi:hypothetical protein
LRLTIIANSGVGDVDELIEGNGIGTLVREFSADAYLQAFDNIVIWVMFRQDVARLPTVNSTF